jgi:hypothetical protein
MCLILVQLGAGVRDGVDAASHAMSATLAQAPDAALLTVYMETACNSVALAAVFAAEALPGPAAACGPMARPPTCTQSAHMRAHHRTAERSVGRATVARSLQLCN